MKTGTMSCYSLQTSILREASLNFPLYMWRSTSIRVSKRCGPCGKDSYCWYFHPEIAQKLEQCGQRQATFWRLILILKLALYGQCLMAMIPVLTYKFCWNLNWSLSDATLDEYFLFVSACFLFFFSCKNSEKRFCIPK